MAFHREPTDKDASTQRSEFMFSSSRSCHGSPCFISCGVFEAFVLCFMCYSACIYMLSYFGNYLSLHTFCYFTSFLSPLLCNHQPCPHCPTCSQLDPCLFIPSHLQSFCHSFSFSICLLSWIPVSRLTQPWSFLPPHCSLL